MPPPKRAVKKYQDRDWAEPTVARFPDEESRDGFVRSVAESADAGWEAKAIVDDVCMASVRWRLGHFLGLNDMAYAQHGRIVLTAMRRWA